MGQDRRRNAEEPDARRRGTGDGSAPRGDAGQTAPADSAGEPGGDAYSIDAEIDGLRSELADLNNKWLRALADLDNYKKRVERDRRRWAEAAKEEIILDLLEVVDNFERALACEGQDASGQDALREGVELILKQLTEVLRRHGVTPIRTEGCEFDPNVHEAVGHVASDECGPNEIVEETQRGYMLGERPLRCSKVVVAK
jgi:molecular chaperone GrpE